MNSSVASVETGLLADWKFNSGDGDVLYDHSGNQNHGTINGAAWSDDVYVPPVPPVPGENNSLTFDGGNDYIQISENDDLENIYQNNFSVSVFVKPETIIAGFLSILRKDGAYNIMIQNGYLVAEKFVGGTMYHSTGNTQFNSEQWYHILVSWNGSNLSLYVDGQLDNNETQTAGINVPITSLWIGMSSAYGQGFNGKIDHLSMWSRLFNNEEIQYLKDYEINSEDSDLVAYWNFNEGSGSTLYDISGNGNNGTINGASWSDDVPSLENDSDNAIGSLGPAGGFVIYDKGLTLIHI